MMISQIESELNNLKANLLELGNLVLIQLDKAGNALKNAETDLANEVVRYEKRINGLEVNVEKAAENILALYSPVANDLRFVLSTLKINLNLERIGDYATSIAKIVRRRNAAFDAKMMQELEIDKMFETCHIMLLTTLEALDSQEKTDTLRSVYLKDDILNDAQDKAPAFIVQQVETANASLPECLELYVVVRKLERVGDHVKNIAEEITFYKEAIIMRHKKKGLKRGEA